MELEQFRPEQVFPQTPFNHLTHSKLAGIVREEQQIIVADDNIAAEIFFGYISPSSTFSLLWELLIIFSIYVFMIEIGFLVGFGSKFWVGEVANYKTTAIYISIIIIFCIDIVISFHRGYYEVGHGRVTTNKQKIQDNYLKGYFIIDLITTIFIILPLFIKDYASDLLQLVFFIKFFKKAYYQNDIFREIQHRSTLRDTFSIALLTIDALIVAHFVACIFIGIDLLLYARQYYQNNLSLYWLSNNADYTNSLIGGPWYIQYIYGQQYSSGTLSTLAPGPFPKNPIEVIYVIIVMLCFIILTSYIADGIVKIFFSEELRRVFHETNIQAFDNFLSLKQVSKAVKQRVQNYFELVWEVEGKVDSGFHKHIISKLSSKLRVQLQRELFHLKSLVFLRYFRHIDLEKSILSIFEQIMTDAHEVLFEPTQLLTDRYLFMMNSGMAKFSVTCGKNESIIALSNIQPIFGIYEFITNQPYTYTTTTVHISHLHRIKQSAFLSVIETLDLKEQLMELQHKVLFNEQYGLVDKICLICQRPHLETNCPEVVLSAKLREQHINEQHSNRRIGYRRKGTKQFKIYKINQQLLNYSKGQRFSSLFNNLVGLIPLAEIIQELMRQEEIDGWYNFPKYMPKFNVKNIKFYNQQ